MALLRSFLDIMDRQDKVNKGIGSDQIQHTNTEDIKRRAPHIINTSDNNAHIDSEGARRSSSEQSEFDRLAWNAYVKLCDIAHTKISVFGDDPIKEKIETELADISLKRFGRQMEPIVPDYNKYLGDVRGDIYHIKEEIREIKRRDKEEGERLFQAIKPSIIQILDANQVINYAFHDQASKRDTDTDYIKSLFIPLENRCEELKEVWRELNEPSQGVLQTDSKKNNLGAFEKYEICERARRETKKFISQLEDTILGHISRLGTAKTTISNIRRNVVQIVEVGFPLDEAISNMQTIVEFSNRFKDEAGLPSDETPTPFYILTQQPSFKDEAGLPSDETVSTGNHRPPLVNLTDESARPPDSQGYVEEPRGTIREFAASKLHSIFKIGHGSSEDWRGESDSEKAQQGPQELQRDPQSSNKHKKVQQRPQELQRDPQSFEESCDRLNIFWDTVRQTILEIDPEDQGKA
jgi:hypothetical protein